MAILVWTGAETTVVDTGRVKAVVTEFIHQKLGNDDRTIVEFHGRLPNIVTRSTQYSISVVAEVIPTMRGYVSIPVEIASGKRVEGRAVISVYIRTFDSVAVAARQLQKHEPIKLADVVFKRIETTMLGDDLITSMHDLYGKRSTRIITSNSIMRHAMVERIPVLKEEDRVTIAVWSRNTVVTSSGIAEEDGAVGDIITVRRAGSHERLRAQVIDARTVEIHLQESVPVLESK